MVDDFHTLFKKDADIARRISPARSNNPFGNSNFATTASGKLAMLRIKLLFEVAARNMPDVFWLPANWTNAFKSAALKYHLEHALTRSNTISEFKTNFTHNVKRSQHTPQTQRLIKQITQGLDGLEKDAQELAKMSDDEIIKKEMSDTFGVVYKGKNAALIYKDLQNLENAILLEKGDKNKGGTHIRLKHTKDTTQQGFVTPDEVENIGQNVRKYLKEHKEPFIDKDGARLYEWQDEQGVNFRLVARDKVSGADTLPTSANEEIITFYSNRNLKDSTNFEFKNPSVAKSYETKPKETPQATAQDTPQAPQKSLLEQARETTERLRAAQEAEQIAQKEAELARLKEMQAKNAEILAQKEAAAGQAINEAQSLKIGMPIKAQKISDTKIIINDNTAPFKAEFIIAKKDDIKPNFERTGTQGRSERQDKVIESVQSDFKPHLIFEQMGGFEGLPIILKDGQVIAGNHRAQAIKGLTGENLARYKQAAKEKFGVDLKDDEVIVRLVKDGDEKELINLAFMSNVGRESNLGEKALANLAKYESNMQNLPNYINADSVFELESQVAKALDMQGNGLNVFDTNLALFSRLAKNSSNTDILESLNTLKNLSQDEKEKVLRMFVSNAGEFHNLAKDTQLKSLNLNDYLADALIVAAKNVDSTTRAANYAKLLDDIITIQASAKEMLKIDPFLFENFKSKALGYALARFARLENPSAKLFEFLKASKADLENLYTGNIFESNKAISDIDIYDFLKHAINSGEDLIDKQGRNIKGEITSRLDDLRKVENALIDSGEIQFAKSKAKPQGREAKETNINSLFADDELQMQATKPTKELNLSDEKDFNELGEFFKLNSKDKEFNEIFAKATKAAQKLGVKVRFDESAARSHFVLNDNTITIAAANKEHFQAQDLLHELIHATTRKALKDFNENPAKAAQSYTKRQIEAINEIISLYQKSKGIAKRQGKDAYALQNVDEFVAELSSGEFRAFLKAQDIFERFIKALIRFFTGDSERLAKNVNSYKALKESYYKILDDYEPPLAPQKIADEKALKSVDELNLNENLAKSQGVFKEKTEQDYTNAYFQKLKKENPNLSDDKLLKEANDQAEFVRSSKNDIKLTTRIAKGYPKRDIRTEKELKDIYDEGSYFSLQQRREEIEDFYNITPLKEFGTNYAEFYRDGQGAVKKLLAEKQGQVAGAFYRQDLGDITLAWGEAGTGKSDGWGLAKIEKYHPEVLDNLSELVEKSPIVKESDNRYLLDTPTHFLAIRKEFDGQKENWLLTAFEKDESIARRRTDLPSSQSEVEKATSTNTQSNSSENLSKSQGETISTFDDLKNAKLAELEPKRDKIKNELDEIKLERNNIRKDVVYNDEKLTRILFEKYANQANSVDEIIAKFPQDENVKKLLKNKYFLLSNEYIKASSKLADIEKEIRLLNSAEIEIKALKRYYDDGIVADEKIEWQKTPQEKLKFYDLENKDNLMNYLKRLRESIEYCLNINPLKEFGTNYAEFYRDGQGAVKKLLAEKQGQVAGAFYRQELGDIDLVWGNEKFGLQHILAERTRQWGEEKALKFISHLDENIQKGQIVEVEKGRIGIKTDLTTIILDKKDDNTFIVTAFRDSGNKKELESLNLVQSKTFTSKNAETTAKDSPVTSQNQQEIIPKIANESQDKLNSMIESKKAYDSELKRLNNELEYTETLLGKVNDRGMIDKINDLRDEILAQKRELLKQDPLKFQKVSQKVSHINQNNDIMSEISNKGGQDGTSNASNGLNAAEKGMPTSEPAGISDGLFGKEQLSNEPRGAGAYLSNSPTHRQQPQTLFSQGASEPNASGGQQRGSNERLRTASGDLRGEVSGDGQNLQAQQGLNVSERFGQDRSEQHSRAKHTIRANSSSGASHSNATAQELVSDTNAAGILSPAEKATIENQTFTQTIDPAKFNTNEILSANILTKNYDKEHLNELIDAGNDIVRLAQLAKNGNKTAERILQNYHTEAVGRGYSGYSMSVNAVEAQENGVKPLSKFNAKDAKEVSEILNEKISTNELKNLLSEFGDTGEWHHTSKFYNKTPHYSVAEMFLSLDKVKKRLALKNTKKDIIKANTQLYNDYISQIDKAAEFVKNAKDIDKSWVLSWFRERKMNAKNYLERENKFGTKAEFDVINEAFKVKTLENHPQFNALFIQQNKENLQNLAKISSGNLEKGQDLDLKNKTLQEIMLKNEKIINYAFLKQIADDLPPAFSKDEFIKALAPNAKGRANIKTPIKDIEINAEQAWEHLLDNSKGEDRTKIGGGLLQTLKKPFFVTKNNEGSYYFYKPFKDERGILNLISIEVPKAARLKYKTSYIADKNKMLELITKHELVYKSW